MLTLFEPGFFPALKDWGGGGGGERGKMAHRHNSSSSISSQMKLKLGSNIKLVMLTSNL